MTGSAAKRHIGEVVLRRYLIEELVGEGSFAWVYRARDRDGETVAVKILYSTQPTAAVRFAREIRVLQALPDTRSLAYYVDHGHTQDGRPALVLEFVDGITLKLGIERRPTLAPDQAVAFMGELCGAFIGLHQLGVAHRDVKPENILLGRHGGIKLIDFGLIRDAQGILRLLEEEDPLEMRVFQDELDRGVLAGTPEYMAPEQFSDSAVSDVSQVRTDTWSDVFSLGVILFELLTGHKPFVMRDVAREEYPQELLRYLRWRLRLRDRDIPRVPGISSALQSIVHKALRRDPRRRQPDARAFTDDLLRYQRTGMGVTSTDESRTQVASISHLMASLDRTDSGGDADEIRSSFSYFEDEDDETSRGRRSKRAAELATANGRDERRDAHTAEAFAETIDARRLQERVARAAHDVAPEPGSTVRLQSTDAISSPAARKPRRRRPSDEPPQSTRDIRRPAPPPSPASPDHVFERTGPLKPLSEASPSDTPSAEVPTARGTVDAPVSEAPWIRPPQEIDDDNRTGLHPAARTIPAAVQAPPTVRNAVVQAPPTVRNAVVQAPPTVRDAVVQAPPTVRNAARSELGSPDELIEEEENLADPPKKGEPAILTAPLDTPSLSIEDFYSDDWGSDDPGTDTGFIDDGFIEQTGEVNLADLSPAPRKKKRSG
jgi:serine/threonine protein kinase